VAVEQDSGVFTETLTDRDFARLAAHLQREYGIHLAPIKKSMLEGRLRRRLQSLSLGSFSEYCDLLLDGGADVQGEHLHMIDVVTTHTTEFFREPNHFEFMVQDALPDLVRHHGLGVQEPLVVWSAGCSTGEEPYTLAMVLSEFAGEYPGLRFRFSILGTDISDRVLQAAARGIYTEERASGIPLALRKKFLLRSREAERKLVRFSPELRETVRFRRLNLATADFGFREPLDVVFCRNVIIYFGRDQQALVVGRMIECLRPGGYLFLGHSETIRTRDFPVVQVAPTVYRKVA
jgi:chemotaxis protein methyltransferase CheR